MIVSKEEARQYLKLDTEEDDDMLELLLSSAETMCLDILRMEKEELTEPTDELLKVAMLYSLGYLYEHREEADHHALTQTLFYLLSQQRREVF